MSEINKKLIIERTISRIYRLYRYGLNVCPNTFSAGSLKQVPFFPATLYYTYCATLMYTQNSTKYMCVTSTALSFHPSLGVRNICLISSSNSQFGSEDSVEQNTRPPTYYGWSMQKTVDLTADSLTTAIEAE